MLQFVLKLLGVLKRIFAHYLRIPNRSRRLYYLFIAGIRFLLRRLGLSKGPSNQPKPKSVDQAPPKSNHHLVTVSKPTVEKGLEISFDGGEPVVVMPSHLPQTKASIFINHEFPSSERLSHATFTTEPGVYIHPVPSRASNSSHLNINVGDSSPGSIIGSRPPSVRGSQLQLPRMATPGLETQPIVQYTGPDFEHHRIKPLTPESHARYDRNIVISEECKDFTITPATTKYVTHPDPAGWVSYVHPEGALYFYNEKRRVYTDAWLFTPRTLNQVESDVDELTQFMHTNGIEWSNDVCLVVDLVNDNNDPKGKPTCYYYFADNSTRTIFFLHKVEASHFNNFHTISGVSSRSHIRYEVESQYWYHCFLFPRSLLVTLEIVEGLRDRILYALGDVMTSATSTSPYSQQELLDMFSLANAFRKTHGVHLVGSGAILGRLMYIFMPHCIAARSQFNNFYGEQGVRLDRTQSIYGKKDRQRTHLINAFSPFLFFAPDVHLRSLMKLTNDGLIYYAAWHQSVKKLIDEWQEFTLFATVLLNANVAFLAIQSIDTSVADPSYRNPAQIASYVSTVASIGSIILGLILVRQHRTKSKDTMDELLGELSTDRTKSAVRMESLAIMYSLPYAFLMWAMITFLVAFSFVWYDGTLLETRLSVAISSLFVAALSGWCIYMCWETRQEESMGDPVSADQDDTEERLRVARMKSSDASSLRSKTNGFRLIRLATMKLKRKGTKDSDVTIVEGA